MIITRPTSVEAALEELADENSLAVGGGTSIGLMVKNRLIEPERLVSLNGIAALHGIEERGEGGFRLGAMTTLHELIHSPIVTASLPSLAFAAARVGNPRVRSVASIGGAIIHGDPRQDLPPVLLSLDAIAHVVGPRGGREIPLAEFFLGFMESAAEEDELVTQVTVPLRTGQRATYTRFTPGSEDDYPTVGVAVAGNLDNEGVITGAKIALGGVDATAILAHEAAEMLVGQRPSEGLFAEAAAVAAAAANPSDDQRGSEEYKRAMVAVWTRRSLARCLAL